MRIMGLDFGAKTVGVAISDPLFITAQGIEIIRRKEENKLRRTFARIEELIEEYQVDEIVLGLPKNMNDTLGPRVEITLAFKDKLERRTGLPVHTWDERLTTVAADKAMIEAGVRRENRGEYVDKIAAVLILQGFLDCRRKELEKIKFTLDTGESVEFYILEQTKLGGKQYILVADTREGDGEALILKEIKERENGESIYEIVDDDTEMSVVAEVFESLLEDVDLM